MRGRKLTFEEVEKKFKDDGYILLTQDFDVVSGKRLETICPNGHRWSTTWGIFSSAGARCPECIGRHFPTIEEIKKTAKTYKYECLSSEYINSRNKLDFKCDLGHIWKISWSQFRRGRRCKVCRLIEFSKNFSGCNHPQWRGGITHSEYCGSWQDKSYKKSIMERDNYKCQNPYCGGLTRALAIHHINYNKKQCHPSNLITLCRSCNAKANFYRDKWYEFYRWLSSQSEI
jgi:5-methylcytosine-specific restriction endonuclease McrA